MKSERHMPKLIVASTLTVALATLGGPTMAVVPSNTGHKGAAPAEGPVMRTLDDDSEILEERAKETLEAQREADSTVREPRETPDEIADDARRDAITAPGPDDELAEEHRKTTGKPREGLTGPEHELPGDEADGTTIDDAAVEESPWWRFWD